MITRILNDIFKRSSTAVLYETKVGAKCLNQLVSSDIFPYVAHGETPFLVEDDLLIGFDGLKDAFSLLGTPISQSPHFELVKMLSENKDISTSDYLKRTASGSLDFRRARKVRTRSNGSCGLATKKKPRRSRAETTRQSKYLGSPKSTI